MPDQLGAKAAAREDPSPSPADDEIEADGDLFAPHDLDSADAGSADAGSADGEGAAAEADADGDTPSPVDTTTDTDAGPEPESGLAVYVPTTSTTPADDAGSSAGIMSRLGFRSRGRLRARKVQRIVRRVDPWSVLKVSLLFYFCVWIMVMVSLILIWGTAMSSGTVGSLESFIAEFFAFEEFKFNGDQLFQIFALGGLIGVFVATAATAVLAVLFNLIADLTGGIRFTVIEEESARRLVNR